MIHPTDEDNKIMTQHCVYLKDLLNQGKLYLAGPTLIESDPFGLIIFETEEEARGLLELDPSIKTGFQVIADFRPMIISLAKS